MGNSLDKLNCKEISCGNEFCSSKNPYINNGYKYVYILNNHGTYNKQKSQKYNFTQIPISYYSSFVQQVFDEEENNDQNKENLLKNMNLQNLIEKNKFSLDNYVSVEINSKTSNSENIDSQNIAGFQQIENDIMLKIADARRKNLNIQIMIIYTGNTMQQIGTNDQYLLSSDFQLYHFNTIGNLSQIYDKCQIMLVQDSYKTYNIDEQNVKMLLSPESKNAGSDKNYFIVQYDKKYGVQDQSISNTMKQVIIEYGLENILQLGLLLQQKDKNIQLKGLYDQMEEKERETFLSSVYKNNLNQTEEDQFVEDNTDLNFKQKQKKQQQFQDPEQETSVINSGSSKQNKQSQLQMSIKVDPTEIHLNQIVQQKLQDLGPYNLNDIQNKEQYQQCETKEKMKLPNEAYYEGQWQNEQIHGIGKINWKDGSIYEGELDNGIAQGYGRLIDAQGNVYDGQFFNNLFHGKGIQIFSDGSQYEGEYVLGLKQGTGKLKISKEFWYEGEFVNNKREGYGQQYWPDGKSYKGYWVNDKMQGEGEFFWKDGNNFKGMYKNDLKEGYGIFTFANGVQYKGNWLKGKQHGEGIYINDKKIEKQGIWENGKIKEWKQVQEQQQKLNNSNQNMNQKIPENLNKQKEQLDQQQDSQNNLQNIQNENEIQNQNQIQQKSQEQKQINEDENIKIDQENQQQNNDQE